MGKPFRIKRVKDSLRAVAWRMVTTTLLAAVAMGMPLFDDVVTASASESVPVAAQLMLTKAARLMEKKEYQQAIDTLLAFQAKGDAPSAGRSDPRGHHHPLIYFALGNGYLMLENLSRAENAYREALERNPDNADAWMNLAGACYRQEKYADAARSFLKAYETAAEKKPERLFYGAAAYLNAGDHQRSIAVFESLLAAHPDRIEPAWKENLIHALLAADQSQRALPHIMELVQTYEGDDKIRWQEILLQQYLALDMNNEALALVMALTRDHPLASRWWKALAHVHLTASRYEEALAALTIYSWLAVPTEEEQKLLADLFLQVDIPVKAAPIYTAMLHHKTDRHLLQHLVMAYQRLGRPEEALEHLEKVGRHVPDPSVGMLKGDLLYELGRYEDAADVYRQVAQTDAQHTGRAWLMAGYAAWQMNDLNGSRTAFERAAGFSDQKKAALAAMRRLEQIDQRTKAKAPIDG